MIETFQNYQISNKVDTGTMVLIRKKGVQFYNNKELSLSSAMPLSAGAMVGSMGLHRAGKPDPLFMKFYPLGISPLNFDEMLDNKIRQLVRNTYYAANPRIVFISKSLITPGNKDPVSK